jgi:hypothetical protein
MAILLSEGLARHEIHDSWDLLDEVDRQSLLAVCEWLLMSWPVLQRAQDEQPARA